MPSVDARAKNQKNSGAAKLPEWAATPKVQYCLIMLDSMAPVDAAFVQDIEMTREEYVELKKHLLALRGFGRAKTLPGSERH